MGVIAKKLSAQSHRVVVIPTEGEALHFRIRKVSPFELFQAGLGLAPSLIGADPDVEPSEDVRVAQIALKVLNDPGALLKSTESLEKLVALGVVGASLDGKAWENDYRVTTDYNRASEARNINHVSSLPEGAVNALANAILDLSHSDAKPTKEDKAGRPTTFPTGAEPAPGSAGETVRNGPGDGGGLESPETDPRP